MNLKSMAVVFKKEIKDLFRDRKTVIVGVLLPLLIFPLMYGFMGKSIGDTSKKVEENLKVSISGERDSSFAKYMRAQKDINIVDSKDIKRDVQDGKIYVGIEIPSNFEGDVKNEKVANLKMIYDDTNQTSSLAKEKVSSLIEGFSKEIVKQRLASRNINSAILEPLSIKQETAAKEKGGFGKQMLSFILPMFLIIYALSSPMAAAIDNGAGEKERGTLEPLLTTQASRMSLLFGKLFAITVMGLIGTLSSMIGLWLSFQVSKDMFGGGDISSALPPVAIVLLGLCTLLLTMIFGAAELAVSIYARSFKEAQTYLTPFTLVGMVGVFGTMYMDVKDVALGLFNIPIVNISLIMKEFIAGIYNPLHLGITFGWTAIYIIGAILFARHMFSREEVVFRT